ncbi:helix-turn-helix transcriptional regulator [Hoeflea sp. CAU 1731]
MGKREETIEFESGSGNVFADLGLHDAPELKLKAAIVGMINAIIRDRDLTQHQAADLLGVPQPKISALKNGKLRGFSLERLLDFMVKLDRNVEISIRNAQRDERPGFSLRNDEKAISLAV